MLSAENIQINTSYIRYKEKKNHSSLTHTRWVKCLGVDHSKILYDFMKCPTKTTKLYLTEKYFILLKLLS